jgi:hypothetical protein
VTAATAAACSGGRRITGLPSKPCWRKRAMTMFLVNVRPGQDASETKRLAKPSNVVPH